MRLTRARRPGLPSAGVDGRWTMERRVHTGRRAGLAAMIAGLALSVVILPGGADAVPSPGYQSPDGSYCYDPNVDCGYAGLESGVYTESFDAYAYAPGLCRTRYARAVRRNLAGFVVFRTTSRSGGVDRKS